MYAANKLVAVKRRSDRTDKMPTFYVHADARGSITSVTDETGRTVVEQGYAPFGATQAGTGESAGDFVGRGFAIARDEGRLGLLVMGSRFYDPGLARFLSPDQFGFFYEAAKATTGLVRS